MNLEDDDIDIRPYYFTVEGAATYSGLSKWRVRELIRREVLAVRYEGSKVLVSGASLRRYLDSLPPVRPHR